MVGNYAKLIIKFVCNYALMSGHANQNTSMNTVIEYRPKPVTLGLVHKKTRTTKVCLRKVNLYGRLLQQQV